MDTAVFESFAVELADAAGEIIRPLFGDPSLKVDTKSDATPVTEADRNAEIRIREMIRARYPDHGIQGEEFGMENDDAEFVWVIDPIDGTKSFITGCPLFGTLIALLHRGTPLVGLIHQPIIGQTCLGNGTTTTLNGKPVRVRHTSTLAAATLLLTDFVNLGKYQNQTGFDRLVSEVALTRTWGDCYGYLLVASGFADIMLDPVVKDWDKLALIPVVRGAGGTITDWQGNDPVTGTSIVAASPGLHAEAIRILNT
ncbi:MAG: histidinol-phosphatase [Verrucomicrobia bacterium]|nr:MAG: histidinol-phosphatase [Verrucomicrobiota bacterium]